MKKVNKKEKVISKNIKGTRKKLSKKKNIFTKFINLIKNNKIIFLIIIVLIISIVSLLFFVNFDKNENVLTINNIDYTEKDFSIYLFSAKYNYFDGKTDINENDLKVIYDEESKLTVGEYLKEVALSDIKTASAIKELANKYNISLNDSDLEELEQEKTNFIKSLGKQNDFKKFLEENDTNEEAYDNMAKTDKLYKKLIKNIFSEGKQNDLTLEELEQAKSKYQTEYFKIKQIILTIIDVNTGKSLSTTTINQKETLANNIVLEAKKIPFDDLIKNYSEDAVDKEAPYDTYYKKGELLKDLESVVLELNPGEVSKPIKTKYAYHIIQKQELDDKKLEDYYNELREDKCIEELKEKIKKLQIIYRDAYENIKIK